MPETLTESFCERCGTRFQFEPPARPKSLTKLRVLSRGLKSYVLMDGLSLSDTMATARTDEERRQGNEHLDRFHETFKFCMDCRQYTCLSCWNLGAGRCLSCAPIEVEASADGPELVAAAAAAEVAPTWEPGGPGVEPEMPAPVEPAAQTPMLMVASEPAPAAERATPPPAVRAPEVAAAADVARAAEPVRAPVLTLAPVPVLPPVVAPAQAVAPPALPAPLRALVLPTVVAPVPPTVVAPVRAGAPSPVVVPARAAQLPSADEPEAAAISVAGTEPAAASEPTAAPTPAPAPVPSPAADLAPSTERVHSAPRSSVAPAAAAPDFDDILARLDFVAGEHHETTPINRSAFEQSHLWARRMAGGTAPREGADPAANAPVAPTYPAEPRTLPVAAAPIEAAPEQVAPPIAPVEPAPVATPAAEEPVAADVAVAAEAPAAAEKPIAADAAPEVTAAAELAVAAEAQTTAETPAPADEPVPTKAADIWWIVAPDDVHAGTNAARQPIWPIPTRAPQDSTQAPAAARPAQPVVHPPAPPPVPTPAWPGPSPASAPSPAITAAQHHQGHPKVAASDAVWAASSRDVLNRPGSGAQACVSCGLALSAAARFCRRCGSPQA